jgi:hypothetical protein
LCRFFNPLHYFSERRPPDPKYASIIRELMLLTERRDQESTTRLGVLASQNPAFSARVMGELMKRYDDAVIEAIWKACKAAPNGIKENLIPDAIRYMTFMGGRYRRLEKEGKEEVSCPSKCDAAIAGLMSLHSMAAQKKYAETVTRQTFEGLCAIGSDYAFHTAAALFYRNIPVLSDPLLNLVGKVRERDGRDPLIHTPEVANGLLRALTEPVRIVSFLFAVLSEQKEETLATLRSVFTKLGNISPQLIDGPPEQRQSLQEIFQTAVAMTLLGDLIEQLHDSAFTPSREIPSSSVMTIFDYRP